LAATLDAIGVVGPLPERPMVYLDAGDDWQPCRQVLAERGMVGEIATRGQPAPIQVGRSATPGPATAGTADPATAHDLLRRL
jgi:hypothetical protein